MTQIYIAPFLASRKRKRAFKWHCEIPGFLDAVGKQVWPYDRGDDPSFYMMRELGNKLTWGVCRSDVRNQIQISDIVVYFAVQKRETETELDYLLCSVATVEQKLMQTEIWKDESLEVFRKYPNLLIRPVRNKANRWEHFEPTHTRHVDWIWRIADRVGLREKDFERMKKRCFFDLATRVRKRPLKIVSNYIVFSEDQNKTYVINQPRRVATYCKGQKHEKWLSNDFSRKVIDLTLVKANKMTGKSRWLHANKIRNAHPVVRFELPSYEAEIWCSQLIDLMRS